MIPIAERHTPERHGRLEILDHPEWIRHIAQWIEPELYIEYGIRDGRCLEVILPYCKKAWGVDLDDYTTTAPNYTHFKMTTREFNSILQTTRPIIDLAFIDACHQSDVVLQDFNDLYPFVAHNGFIVLHDTYPIRRAYTAPVYCSDCWKTPDLIKEKYADRIELLTIPIMPGLTLIRKCEDSPRPNWITADERERAPL